MKQNMRFLYTSTFVGGRLDTTLFLLLGIVIVYILFINYIIPITDEHYGLLYNDDFINTLVFICNNSLADSI